MDMTRKQRQLQLALEEKQHRAKLVHSKHVGWLAVGMTTLALSVLGATTATSGQTVSAAANDNKTSQVAQTQPSTSRVWTLRPVSEIKAQFEASNKTVYDIKWGDTLSTISEALNESGFTTSVDRLAEINHIANVDLIYAGAKLYLQGSGDNATVTTKDSNGNDQTYNLNPSKPAVATPADKAAAESATPSKTGTSGATVTPTNPTFPSNGGSSNGPSTTPSTNPATGGNTTPSTPVTKVSITVRALDQDGRVLKATTLEANVGLTLPISAPTVSGYALADGNPATKTIKVAATNPSVDFTYKRVAKNTNKSVTKNVDEAGNDLGQKVSSNDYHQLSSITKTTVTTLPNGDTLTTITTTVTYHKIAHTTKHVTVNVDKAGNQLASTDGYTLSKTTTASKDTIAANGDITTTITTTNTYAKTPVAQKATVTVKYVDAETGASIKPSTSNTETVGDTFTASAPTISGYTLQGNATQSVKVDAAGNTLTFSYKKDASTHNTDNYVTKNVDEQGNDLGNQPDASKYHKLSTSKPTKTNIQILPNGDTITTYTTTVTYHKIVHTDKSVTKNVDEQGNALPDKVDTAAYKQMSSSDKKATTTADNGDTTTTTTTTVVWHKLVNTNKYVTKNVDEAGNDLGQDVSTKDYHKLTSSQPVKSVTTAPNGDTTTTYTTTVTYHKIARTTKHVTVNVDEQGNPLASTDGYDFVKSSDASSDSVAANGDVTTTITTTNVYKKHVVVPTTAKVTIVAKDTDGNTLKTTSADATIGDNYTATAPTIDGYDLQGNSSQTVKVSADGNTITFTYKKHVEVPTTAKVTIVAKDTDGNTLKTSTADAKIGDNYTATAPEISGYDLQGNNSQTVKVDANGNTITFTYKKHEVVPTTAKVTIVAKDTDGNMLKTTTVDANVGQTYTATAPSIDGYDIQGANSQSVTVSANGNTITFTYKKQAVAVDTTAVANRLAQLVNNWRTQNGLAALKVDSNLQAGAAVRAQQEADAVKAGGMNAADHNLPDGRTFNYEPHLQQYGSTSMAENLLITNGSTVETIAQNAFNQWKNSAGHNANMLGQYTDEGMGVVQLPNGGFLAVQDFGYKLNINWDANQFNSALRSSAGVSDQDVIDSANKMGLSNLFTGNYYISQHMFDKKSDFEDWNADTIMTNNWDKSILSSNLQGHISAVGVLKNGQVIGYVVIKSGLSKPASQLIAEGYTPW